MFFISKIYPQFQFVEGVPLSATTYHNINVLEVNHIFMIILVTQHSTKLEWKFKKNIKKKINKKTYPVTMQNSDAAYAASRQILAFLPSG